MLLMTVGPLVSNTLEDFIINVELRDGDDQTLSDLPRKMKLVPISLFIADEFRLLESSKLRSTHISWDKFGTFIEKTFQLTLTRQDCELGYKYQPRIKRFPAEYFVVSTATAFTNAIGVLFNASRLDPGPGRLTLCLWSPVPDPPISLHHRRISDIASIGVNNASPLPITLDTPSPARSETYIDLTIRTLTGSASPAREAEMKAEVKVDAEKEVEAEVEEVVDVEAEKEVEETAAAGSAREQPSPTGGIFAGKQLDVGKLIQLGDQLVDQDKEWEKPERDDYESDGEYERRVEEYEDHVRDMESQKYIPTKPPKKPRTILMIWV
jgi:hypothetical protein